MFQPTRFIIGTSISAVFSFLTVIAFTVEQKTKNLQGFICRCYFAAYTGCMILLTTHGLLYQYLDHFVDSWSYRWTMIGSFYFFVATMFWLNVMSIDIWMTFLKLQSNPEADVIEGLDRKFVPYSIYAWGSPLVPILVVRFYPSETEADSVTTIAAVAVLPIIGITICNIGLLISTAFMIKQRLMETTGIGNGFAENVQWFCCYVFLFGMMTLILILVVIGLFTDWMYPLTSLVEKQSIITFAMSIYCIRKMK